MTAHGTTTARVRRRRAGVRRGNLRLLPVALVGALALLVGVGFGFAGSAGTIADGVRIAGVDVGGLTPRAARTTLARRAAELESTPVTFVSGSRRWKITPKAVGLAVDWSRAVGAAADRGGGFGVVRGFRRAVLRFSPVDIEPHARADQSALEYELGLLAADVEQPRREPRLVRHGLTFEVVPGATGRVLDRAEARRLVIGALTSFERKPVQLPIELDRPRTSPAQMNAIERRAQRIVSAPVTLRLAAGVQREVEPRELARMLRLPDEGVGRLAFGGAAADRYFGRLDRFVSKPAKNADFVIDGFGKVAVVPSAAGIALDVPRTAAALIAAAERTDGRVARVVVAIDRPERTTAAARAMGITGLVGSYETEYGGIANRIHNVQLVARLIDGKLIAPGATFSFNGATGERTADKGFLEAPVIINGELETGLGGGVCQVSTTVFNAAYEAGLPITSRTNHALYISHYPLGRDATVDYPGIDLKFVNDTGHWLLLRTFVGSSSLVVNLYGTPQDRRVETETSPLTVVSPPPVEKRRDASLEPGSVVVESYGVPAQRTSVHRRVYSADGKLLSDSTWYSSYEAEPKIVLLGPKKAKPERKQPARKQKQPKDELTPSGEQAPPPTPRPLLP